MRYFSNMTISRMIIMLVAIPVLAIGFFAGQTINKEFKQDQVMAELVELVGLSVSLSNLVHEQQKERGASAIFLGSKGEKFKTELAQQRANTNSFRQKLDDYISNIQPDVHGAKFANSLKQLLGQMDEMKSIRARVDSLSVAKKAAIVYYSNLNQASIKMVDDIGKLSKDPETTMQFVAYISFLQSKERAGLERAYGSSGLAAGKFEEEAFKNFKVMIADAKRFNQVFLNLAKDVQKTQFNNLMQSDLVKELEAMRTTIVEGAATSDFKGLTSKAWFSKITAKINGLKKIEDFIANGLSKSVVSQEAAAQARAWNGVIVASIILIFVLALSIFIMLKISRSFAMIIQKMDELAKGNLEVELPEVTKNEVGAIIKSVQVFKDSAIEKVKLEARQVESKKHLEQEKRDLMTKLADDFDANVGAIVNTVSSASQELQKTAQSMSDISQATSSNANLVASSSDVANTNVQSVAAASEEMSQSITEINQQVTLASNAAKTAVSEVDKTSIEMKSLATTVDQIESVVGLIATIADQTNLLALNATIESARAGEAGRGFAVVASEVKGLAGKTAQATDEIAQHIREIQTATKQALNSMGGISTVIIKVEEISTNIAATMEEQGYATEEISSNAQSAATGTLEVSKNIAEVTQASVKANVTSEEVMHSAEGLMKQSDLLKDEVAKFTSEIRSTG